MNCPCANRGCFAPDGTDVTQGRDGGQCPDGHGLKPEKGVWEGVGVRRAERGESEGREESGGSVCGREMRVGAEKAGGSQGRDQR